MCIWEETAQVKARLITISVFSFQFTRKLKTKTENEMVVKWLPSKTERSIREYSDTKAESPVNLHGRPYRMNSNLIMLRAIIRGCSFQPTS